MIRSDAASVTKLVIQEAYAIAQDLAYFKYDVDGDFIADICKHSKGIKKPLWSLTLGIARAYKGMYEGWNFDSMDQLEEDLIEAISQRFRTPLEYFAEGVKDVILKHYPAYNHTALENATLCFEELMKEPLHARDFGVAMHHAMGYVNLAKMGLGDVMLKAVSYAHYAGKWIDRSTYTEGQWEFFNATRDVLTALMGIDGVVSVKNFVGYLGLSQFEFSKVASVPSSRYFQCDMSNRKVRKLQSCAVNTTSECCQLEKAISSRRENVLRYMKYFVGPQATTIRQTSEAADATPLSRHLNYSLDENVVGEPLASWDPTILACKYGNGSLRTDCDLFQKTFNNDGIGYTFNAEAFWKMYKRTKGNYWFYKQFVSTNNAYVNGPPRLIERIGRGFSLEIYVRLTNGDWEIEDTLATLHDPSIVPNIRKETFKLVPGTVYDISVVPSAIRTTDDGLKLQPSSRDCKAKYESDDLNIFNIYSQSACIFECQLKMAINKCHCSNWDYPVYNDSISYCNIGGPDQCFLGMMKAPMDLQNCNCPNDCSINQYSIVSTVTPISDFETICNASDPELILGRYQLQTPYQYRFFNRCLHWVLIKHLRLRINELEVHQYLDYDLSYINKPRKFSCQSYVQSKVTVVRIFVGPRSATQIEWDARVSFSSQLASLGRQYIMNICGAEFLHVHLSN